MDATAVLILLVILFLFLLPGIAVGRLARQRGRGFGRWFAVGLICWPLAAIALFATENRALTQQAPGAPP
jgi:hypothetical protein